MYRGFCQHVCVAVIMYGWQMTRARKGAEEGGGGGGLTEATPDRCRKEEAGHGL